MEDLTDDLIELVDENGDIVKFKLMDVTEYKGEKYTLLLPAEENEDMEYDDVYIFRFDEQNNRLETIEDEVLLDEIFEFYQKEAEEEQTD